MAIFKKKDRKQHELSYLFDTKQKPNKTGSLDIRYGTIQINPFSTNVPLTDKPGWFLQAKCHSSTGAFQTFS